MATCSACGHENPEAAKFCMECATPLRSAVSPVAEERKVVTVLFCDLVGFTATSEMADPEDVNQMLNAYAAMTRQAIEAFGGTVEKFIGDAVVGVFGVPAAHEDDPERAVRAGLRIAEEAEALTAVGDEPLRLRVGINTGEALVRLGIVAGTGEGFLRGDAINTASRLQSAAPEMGVAVGEATYQATSLVFEYKELEPATLKGKSEPVRLFVAKAPRARLGSELVRTHDTPYVGREIDLAILRGVFDKALAASSVQLVTVVGEPGIGKSRIVAELARHVDAIPELVRWRQGRCLPYGEGITFWALGEVLKAHAGILESDDADTATDKLEVVLPEGAEREWFRQRLLPLLGLETTTTAERDELFTAWRRFLEHVAERNPLVLVFEDLHWADPAMLAFLEHLADHAQGVPLLVVGTARPELFEQHPDFAAGLPNVNRINLAPLSAEETARLISALLEAAVIPAELQAPILERSGGNPLYAEEFVRLLKDRDLLVRTGSSWELAPGAEIPFPDSVQALIAARLDTLSAERKAMLADAAVIGKVFWSGAVAAMGNLTEAEVAAAMHELVRKELVRSSRRSSMEGESEYAFWHVLARDVAYGQIPRASRASRHVAAAAWIESKAPDRVEDHADVLAHHYSSALELARAAGQTDQAHELEGPALRFLTLSGERALGLDTDAALESFERALALTPPGHPARAEALGRFGEAAYQAARFPDSGAALEEALELFRARDDRTAAAAVLGMLRWSYDALNDPRRLDLAREALALLEGVPPGPPLIRALADAAGYAIVNDGEIAEGRALADRALTIAQELGLPVPHRALGFRAMVRLYEGDAGCLDDYRDALTLAKEIGDGQSAGLLYNNLGIALLDYEGARTALDVIREGLRFAEARGLRGFLLLLATSELDLLLSGGDFGSVVAKAPALAERAEAAGDEPDAVWALSAKATAAALRGDADGAIPFLERIEDGARLTGRPDYMVFGFGGVALTRAALGQPDRAASLLAKVAAEPRIESTDAFAWYLPMLVRTASSVGAIDAAETLITRLPPRFPFAEHSLVAAEAALAESRGDVSDAAERYADAASRWETFQILHEQGFALLGRGRCLLALSDPPGATDALRRARDLFARCGMRPALEETDDLLARAMALTS